MVFLKPLHRYSIVYLREVRARWCIWVTCFVLKPMAGSEPSLSAPVNITRLARFGEMPSVALLTSGARFVALRKSFKHS